MLAYAWVGGNSTIGNAARATRGTSGKDLSGHEAGVLINQSVCFLDAGRQSFQLRTSCQLHITTKRELFSMGKAIVNWQFGYGLTVSIQAR